MLAIPGGFVEVYESLEKAVIREIKEETGLKIDPTQIHQFKIFSEPGRDKRRHTASSIHVVKLQQVQFDTAKAGDDAKSLERLSLKEATLHTLGKL